jgi:hypothetical protein
MGPLDGYVEARWENDRRNKTLLSELPYADPDGVVWIAPAGSVVDGAQVQSWQNRILETITRHYATIERSTGRATL